VDSTCLDARLPSAVDHLLVFKLFLFTSYQVKGDVLIVCEIDINTLQVPSISVTLVFIYKSTALARK
jgi:hypothetical protein